MKNRPPRSSLWTMAVVACLASFAGWAATPTESEMAEAARWASAKFKGVALAPEPRAGLEALANHGPVDRNARGGKPLRVGGQAYTRGLYCHASSQVIVRLPSAGLEFTALVGVDSNDQTVGGRGSVRFAVEVEGKESFRSPLLREGMPGVPVKVDLRKADRFVLLVDDGGDGIACDQADWAEARVKLEDGREAWLGDLPLLGAGATPPSLDPPFSFNCGGKPSADLLKDWRVTRASRALDSNRVEHTVTWLDEVSGLQTRCVAVEYRDFPTLEWTVHFRNTGATDTPLLTDLRALDLLMDRPADGEFVLHHQKGDDCTPDSYEPARLTLAPRSERSFAPAGGRPTCRAFPYFNLEWAGGGLVVVVGWPGQWAASFSRDSARGLRIRAGQELTRFKLHPGEEARTPLIALQFWSGDRGRAQNLWRRWMLAHNLPRTRDGKLPPPIFSSCSGGFFPGLRCNEADELRFIDAFTQAGVKLDYWWMDAGWYPCGNDWPQVGTWMPDASRFPRGLKAVSDHAHAKGMGLIVWFEPERVSAGSWLAQNHPEWILGGQNGGLLNLGNPAARGWLTDHVDKLLTEQGIDLYRQDFNIDPLGFWRKADAADRQGLTEMRHVQGYLAYWDELRRRHPRLLIDSCASGGRRNDLETLRRAVPLLRSDYQSFQGDPAYAPGNQGHTYGLSLWIPYYGQGVYDNPRDLLYSVRSSMSPAFGFCADVRKPGVDWAAIRRIAADWRRVAHFFLGDFHPLTPYSLDPALWMAWQFDLPEKGEGMIQVFRRDQCIYESARLRLRGLDPAARYRVTDLDSGEARAMAGRELLERGLTVAIANQPGQALIVYARDQ